jgi:hypothetical protein
MKIPRCAAAPIVCLVLLATALPAATAQAPGAPQINVQAALDRPTQLVIENRPLGEALQTISRQSGIAITMGPTALSYLPYGDQTHVTAKFPNVRLRDGLQAICNQLAMHFVEAPGGVEIVPTPPLVRLGRTATWDELTSLSKLIQTTWKDDDEVEKFCKRLRFEGIDGERDKLARQLSNRLDALLPGNAVDVLTRGTETFGWTWHPRGSSFVVLPIGAQYAYQLGQRVSLQYQNRPLAEVVQGLSQQVNIPIRIDPAAGALIPERTRLSFSLIAENVTGQETLERIALATGLAFQVSDQGVLLFAPQPSVAAGTPPGATQTFVSNSTTGGTTMPTVITPAAGEVARDPIVGKIIRHSPTGEFTYEWFIRESDLTPEERERLRRMKAEAIKGMKEKLPAE